MNVSRPTPKPDEIMKRWQKALLHCEPSLPRPVIDAMIQNVVKGPLGESLCQLEEGLMQLQTKDVDTLTGSEARTLLAILAHVRVQAEQIEQGLRQLWSSE